MPTYSRIRIQVEPYCKECKIPYVKQNKKIRFFPDYLDGKYPDMDYEKRDSIFGYCIFCLEKRLQKRFDL